MIARSKPAVRPPPNDPEESVLVGRARHEATAFAELYRRHRDEVLNYLYRRTGDAHAAEDLTAEVFLNALLALPRYRERGIPVRFWFLRIATRCAGKWARQQVRRPRALGATADVVDERNRTAVDDRDADRATAALLRLPLRYQTALSLHYLEGLPVADVARVVGCAEGTVKARLSRGRDRLRRQMAAIEAEQKGRS